MLDLDDTDLHHRVAMLFDNHVLLAYLNGEEWYGIHPVIEADVLRRARLWDERQRDEGSDREA